MHWLRCLARWMQMEQKMELRIDELQPTMLKGYWRFGLLYGLVVGLTFGVMVGLFTTPFPAAAVALAVGVSIGLPGCLLWKWPVKIMSGLAWGMLLWLVSGPVFGLIICLLFILIMGNEQIRINPLRSSRFPASCQAWRDFIGWLLILLIIMLAVGLALGLVLGLVQAQGIGLYSWLAFVSTFMLALGLPLGLATGLQTVTAPLSKTTQLQQRLREALYSSLLGLLAGITIFMQGMFLAEELWGAVGLFFTMQYFYMFLFIAAIINFLFLGTNEILLHYLLRLCLHLEGQLPLRLVPWLEAMQRCKILQRVGGSFHFLPKQL